MKKKLAIFLFFAFLGTLSAQTLTRIDSLAGSEGVVNRMLGMLDSTFFYVANKANGDFAIKSVKGTQKPVTLIDSIPGASFDSRFEYNFLALNGKAYFAVKNNKFFYSEFLYSSDGTKAGTKKLLQSDDVKYLTLYNDKIAFYGEGSLCIYDPKTDLINKTNSVYFFKGIKSITVMNNTLYFIGRTDNSATFLMQSKGVSGDLKKIKQLISGTDYTEDYDIYMNASNNRLYFFYYDANDNNNFYTSDGTSSGTKILKVFDQNFDILTEKYGVTSNGKYYFIANGKEEGYEVWESDGTIAGTRAFDFTAGNDSTNPLSLMLYDGKPYFNTYYNLMYIDGTTPKIALLNVFDNYNSINLFRDSILIAANIAASGQELAITNGTGYTKLTNGNAQGYKSFKIRTSIAAGNRIYFSAQKGSGNGYELWMYERLVKENIAPLNVSIQEQNKIKCFGDKTASVSISVSGGTIPYKYLWSNGATTNSLSNIGAGFYKATVTAANGFVKEASISVTEPSKISLTTTTKPGNPQYKNGNAQVIANGGVVPYSYLWNTIPTQTQNQANNLAPGVYFVTVTDANQCKSSVSVTVGLSTSSKDDLQALDVQIFPNPTTSLLNVYLNEIDVNTSVDKLIVLDNTGKEITQQHLLSKNAIDVSHLTDGIYILKLIVNEKVAISTFIIKH